MLREGSTAAIRAGASAVASGFSRTSRTSSSSKGSVGSNVADIVLPAHRRKCARFAAVHIVWSRGKFAASDGVERVREPLLRLAEHFVPRVGGLKQRNDSARSLEREVRGFA